VARDKEGKLAKNIPSHFALFAVFHTPHWGRILPIKTVRHGVVLLGLVSSGLLQAIWVVKIKTKFA